VTPLGGLKSFCSPELKCNKEKKGVGEGGVEATPACHPILIRIKIKNHQTGNGNSALLLSPSLRFLYNFLLPETENSKLSQTEMKRK